jgi:hypothetical protein
MQSCHLFNFILLILNLYFRLVYDYRFINELCHFPPFANYKTKWTNLLAFEMRKVLQSFQLWLGFQICFGCQIPFISIWKVCVCCVCVWERDRERSCHFEFNKRTFFCGEFWSQSYKEYIRSQPHSQQPFDVTF